MRRAILIGLLIGLAGIVNTSTIASADEYRGVGRRDNWWQGWRDIRNDGQRLEGTWYLNGDRYRRAEIVPSGRGLVARNENGHTTRLEVNRYGDVYARDWQGGLRGDVRRDRIEWANGTTWTRVPNYGTARYR
jgi:hypothetical protein